MTSTISKEDLEDELYKAGIRSVVIRKHLMRMIEQYARRFTLADPDLPPVNVGDLHGYKYMCPSPPKGCGQRKYIGEFPEIKKLNSRSPVPCNECMKKKA